MNRLSIVLMSIVSAVIQFSSTAFAEGPRYSLSAASQKQAEATYADIKNTLGIVPSFLRNYPVQSIDGAWREMKGVQLNPDSALSGKTKELIGLAVASQIPCTFCTTFHTEAAKLNGGTTDELKEAIAIAASARHWSAFFSGIQLDQGEFHSDTDKMIAKLKATMEDPAASQTMAASLGTPIDTPEAAYRDIEKLFGFVPNFVRRFPAAGIAGAWQDFKQLQLNPNTALSGKDKDLISIAVDAQIPCPNCLYFDTQAAKLDGATNDEIQEAVTMAAITRRWSTVLNGLQTDPAAFKKEMDQIVAHIKQTQEKAKTK